MIHPTRRGAFGILVLVVLALAAYLHAQTFIVAARGNIFEPPTAGEVSP